MFLNGSCSALAFSIIFLFTVQKSLKLPEANMWHGKMHSRLVLPVSFPDLNGDWERVWLPDRLVTRHDTKYEGEETQEAYAK